ncbi:SDR family NAD(P)-dependent oxidoreductase [Paroceanicella profunda]|uniref:SDR family NAD(P)-dependent oxidoreductase n=1 Tax=Paroceanicella profunda TaxID=2579971 RepID=A0A5B8FI48_9RHOB|nr:SDR family NAD(P)-dependent oxidoreductase [Paroceanicella profunda]QDL92678.1 SDR family NAD(P)-dependent oxidoreductase [Paroceanicella profunda]QDL92683.1 SDR family NAD(P)-dependent oxidoreductase [Paroceanicella profunda]
MTERTPLAPPPRKDPTAVTRLAHRPPGMPSRAGLCFAAHAARGTFALQECTECAARLWPPRDACPHCLSADIPFTPAPVGGEVIAQTTVRVTHELFYRDRGPWRVGTVKLDCGPVVTANLHRDVATGARVRMIARLDLAGTPLMMALPEQETPLMDEDPALRTLTAHPRHRRVLVTDGRSALGQELARALLKAGAAKVFLGVAEGWKPLPGRDRLEAEAGIDIVPLDLTDTRSVVDLAGAIGGKTDIVVNTADHVRPGSVMGQSVALAQEAFETNVFGLQRLAQVFGPALLGRANDGLNNAVALMDVTPVQALSNWNVYGMHSASAAARLSVLQGLRAEMREGGIRVMSVFAGPMDDDWHQAVPPPKLAPRAVAAAVVAALCEGIEESFVGDVAQDVFARFRADPKVLERELQR